MGQYVSEQIKVDLRKLISEISEKPLEEVKDESRFAEDLGIDSMMALEVVASIEKKYKTVIPEAEIPTIRSLNNIYELLNRLVK